MPDMLWKAEPCCVCAQNFLQEADLALQLYASQSDAQRIRYAVSETAVADWSQRFALNKFSILLNNSSVEVLLCHEN